MTFGEKLKRLMHENGLTQTQVCRLTGVGAPSISQYLSGDHEPTKKRRRDMALALGVDENYFEELLPDADIKPAGVNLPVSVAAKLMKKSAEWVEQGLRDGVFPWGYAVKLKKWSYFISSIKFTECTGIEIPTNDTAQ